MVHEPSFFTVAVQEVRRLRSRSVAVIESRSPAASNRKFDKIGIVVLRSTTPCVAVNSLSSSAWLRTISRAALDVVLGFASFSTLTPANGMMKTTPCECMGKTYISYCFYFNPRKLQLL